MSIRPIGEEAHDSATGPLFIGGPNSPPGHAGL